MNTAKSPLTRISIVIPVYNCDEFLQRCLESLAKACGDNLPETFVIDNAGLESTHSLINSYAPLNIKYVKMRQDGGFTGACNVGYSLCTREFVVLVNSDIVFHVEPFSALVNFMDDHPQAAIAQGSVVLRNGVFGEDGFLDDSGIFFTPWGLTEMYFGGKSPSDPVVQRPCRVYYAYGALFFVRRGCEQKAGGFLFHDHFYAYHEETDLCHRTWLGGNEVWYVPTPPIDHAHSATLKKNFNPSVFRERMLSNARFSLLSCLGPRGLLTVYPLFETFQFCQAIIGLLHGTTSELMTQCRAIRLTLAKRHQLMETRRLLQRLRTRKDGELFKIIMKTRNPVSYVLFKLKKRFCAPRR